MLYTFHYVYEQNFINNKFNTIPSMVYRKRSRVCHVCVCVYTLYSVGYIYIYTGLDREAHSIQWRVIRLVTAAVSHVRLVVTVYLFYILFELCSNCCQSLVISAVQFFYIAWCISYYFLFLSIVVVLGMCCFSSLILAFVCVFVSHVS